MDDEAAADRVRAVVVAIDEAWRAARWDLLADQLAPGVALAPPGEAPPVVGVEACVDTWRAFAAVAQVARYAAGAPSIHVEATPRSPPARGRWRGRGTVATTPRAGATCSCSCAGTGGGG